jgi:hypothetical protein
MGVSLSEGKKGAIVFEAEGLSYEGLRSRVGVWSGCSEAGSGGEVGWRAGFIMQINIPGRSHDAIMKETLGSVESALDVEKVTQGGEYVSGKAKCFDFRIVEKRVGQFGLQGMPERLLGNGGELGEGGEEAVQFGHGKIGAGNMP